MDITISGDLCPIYELEQTLKSNNTDILFSDIKDILNNCDLNIVNLECPLTNSSNKSIKHGPNLKSSPQVAEPIAKSGFNLVTLANNHIMDYGKEGLIETIQTCKQNNIETIGAGESLQSASQPFIITKDNISLGILNYAENEFLPATNISAGFNPFDPIKVYKAINSLKKKVDFVIVIIHGGVEYYSLPSPSVKERYRFCVDVGANMVIGHHPHVFSGYELYKESAIYYSLGNFLFPTQQAKDISWHKGFILKINLKKDKLTHKVIPYNQLLNENKISLLAADDRKVFDEKFNLLNNTIMSDELLNKEWQYFSKIKASEYFVHFSRPYNRYLNFLKKRKLFPFFFSKKDATRLFNIISCESHREITLNTLKSKFLVDEEHNK